MILVTSQSAQHVATNVTTADSLPSVLTFQAASDDGAFDASSSTVM